jgi:hypothetical protein
MDPSGFDLQFKKYQPWFYAAAVYNLLWGMATVLAPNLMFELIGLPVPAPAAFWQVIGMFVLVYALGYWWAGRHPYRFRHYILIGFIGKLLGPIGFVLSVLTRELPLQFGWIILLNDLIWWPSFASFLLGVIRKQGIKSLLLGN